MECIRIEHKSDGLGIFQYRHCFDENNNKIHNTLTMWPEISNRHANFNSPHEDDLDLFKDKKKWYCAYKSIEQMQQWITPKELKDLISKGYIIKLLNVEEYQLGKHQIIYTKQSIKQSTKVL